MAIIIIVQLREKCKGENSYIVSRIEYCVKKDKEKEEEIQRPE